MLGLLDQAAVNLNVIVVGIGLRTQLNDGLAVNGHPSLDDQQFGFTARSDARRSENLLETLFRHYSVSGAGSGVVAASGTWAASESSELSVSKRASSWNSFKLGSSPTSFNPNCTRNS